MRPCHVALVLGLTIGRLTSAQVQIWPMLISTEARPGDMIVAPLNLENTSQTAGVSVSLQVVDLVQAEDGRIDVIEEPAAPGMVLGGSGRCGSWMSLERQAVEMEPNQTATVGMEVRVPQDAKGMNWAAVLLTSGPEEDAAVAIQYRYVVPVLISIGRRRPARDVQITDLGLSVGPQGQTQVYMALENTGSSYSQVSGTARVSLVSGPRRHTLFPRVLLGQSGILPGARIVLKADLPQALQRGTYQIAGSVSIDHRFTERLEREVAFGTGPQLDLQLARLAQQTHTLVLDPVEGSGDTRADPRLAFAADYRPMRLLLERQQGPGEPVFAGQRGIMVRTNFKADLTASAQAASPAGGIWLPELRPALGEPGRIELRLTGRQIQVARLAGGVRNVVRLVVTVAPRL